MVDIDLCFVGEWFASCSQGPGYESAGTNVFGSEYGYGYDEEESFNDHTAGLLFYIIYKFL